MDKLINITIKTHMETNAKTDFERILFKNGLAEMLHFLLRSRGTVS